MKSERPVGKHPALGAPYGSQATPNAEYWPRVLEKHRLCERQAIARADSERRARRTYQVLALLGWAAVVVMGVWG